MKKMLMRHDSKAAARLLSRSIPAVIIALLVAGCGQKGPLELPQPQYPAPSASPASNP